MTITTDRPVDAGAVSGGPVPPPNSGPAPRPAPGAAPAGSRIRIPKVTVEGVATLIGSAFGGAGLTWLVFERVLPLSGILGFWLFAYFVFLALFAAVGASQWPGKVVVDKLVSVLLWTAGLLVLAVVVTQIIYITYRGWDAVTHLNFFTQTLALTGPLEPLTSGGVLHAIVGSLEQMGIATVIAVPLGVLAALFLVEVGGPLARPVRIIVEAMTALPEIIAGLFIYAFVILTLGFQTSGFAAALALTVMMIPIVTRTSEVILRLIPNGLRESSYALGGSQVRTVFMVLLPTARSGLATAVILAMARAVGETSPVLLTAGYTAGMNANPFTNPQTSLPLLIFTNVKAPQDTSVSRAFGAALVLMAMVLILFVLARLVGGRAPGDLSKRQLRRLDRATRRQVEPAQGEAGLGLTVLAGPPAPETPVTHP